MNTLSSRQLMLRREVAAAAVQANPFEPATLPASVLRSSIPVVDPASALAAAQAVIAGAFPGEPVGSHGFGPSWLLSAVPNPSPDAFPAFGALAVSLMDGEPVACAVQLSSFGETLTAAGGEGAELDGRRLQIAGPRGPEDTFILSSELILPTPAISEVVLRLAGWRMPSPRSSAVALAVYLATGRIDGFTHRLPDGAEADGLAATLLVAEAGGRIMRQGASLIAAAHNATLDDLAQRLKTVR